MQTNPVVGGAKGPQAAASGATGQTKKNPNEVGKDQFLLLLVAQLRNQDPLNPLQNSEFVSQLAQFTALEQLIAIRNALERSSQSSNPLGHEAPTRQ